MPLTKSPGCGDWISQVGFMSAASKFELSVTTLPFGMQPISNLVGRVQKLGQIRIKSTWSKLNER